MTKRMLINASQGDELRVALVDGKNLYDLDVERRGKSQTKASIFKGRVTRVEPSLEAAFVDFGGNRHGFLPMKEVAREYFHQDSNYEHGRPNIKDVLRPGQELIVQVEKEERGTKGAALTTFISLAGRYLVLMPNNPRAGGISRRIEGEERSDLKDVINQLSIPESMGLIVRTAGVGRSVEELQWDLSDLLTLWNAICAYADTNTAPLLIHKDSDVIVRAIRDYLRPDIQEIIVDTPDSFQQVQEHLKIVRPDFVSSLKLHQDSTPLFSAWQIETQIESAFKREIALPNGASIVIDRTEALIAIDINSAKATEGNDIEETAVQANLNAATEIARQLRLRDIGGLIVIDFIDMSSTRNQRMVENKIKEELKNDRARIQMGRISRFGLLEMSRQRLRPALGETMHITCPRCDGQGSIRGIHSISMAIIRVIEEETMSPQASQINVQVPVDIASYLLNEKRDAIVKLEQTYQVNVLIIPNKHFETPHYEIQILKKDDLSSAWVKKTPSYKQITQPQTAPIEAIKPIEAQHQELSPAIKHITLPAPNTSPLQSSLIKRIWTAVFGTQSTKISNVQPERDARNTQSEGDDSYRRPHQNHTGKRSQQQNGRKDNRKRHGHNRRQRGGSNKSYENNNTGHARPHQTHSEAVEHQPQQQVHNKRASHHENLPQQSKPSHKQAPVQSPVEHSTADANASVNVQAQQAQTKQTPPQQRSHQQPKRRAQQQQHSEINTTDKPKPVEYSVAPTREEASPKPQTPVITKAESKPVVVENTIQAVSHAKPSENVENTTKTLKEEKPREKNLSVNTTSFVRLTEQEKQNAFVPPVETKLHDSSTQTAQPLKQVVSKRSTYDEKPHERTAIMQQKSSKPIMEND